MNRFFVDKENIKDNMVEINGDDVKHIKNVLRLKDGDCISICDGCNNEYIASIEDVNKNSVLCKIQEKCDVNRESEVKITLYQALAKGQKMDLIIQKAVELGANEIIPVQTARCVTKVSDVAKENKKVQRWNKIAYGAAKQSKRGIVPQVKNIITFKELLNQVNNLDRVIVPYENEENLYIKNAIKGKQYKNIGIVIGPEGGFEEDEIKSLEQKECDIVTLGPRILRTETAGLATITILIYELEEN